MIDFDDLPASNRSLILATLGLDLAWAECSNILELARKRNKDVAGVWRDVCQRTGQPRCTMPARILEPRSNWSETPQAHSSAKANEPKIAAAAPTSSASKVGVNSVAAAASVAKANNASPAMAATSRAKAGGVDAGVAATSVKAASPASALRGHRTQNRQAMLITGVCAVLIVCAGILALRTGAFSTKASLQTTNARPDEVIRTGKINPDRGDSTGCIESCGKPEFDPNSLPAPKGTIRRLDAISNSFMKR